MLRLLTLLILTVLAVAVAALLQRRRPEVPSAPSYRAPSQVDRSDFVDPASEQLLIVFTSATCSSCESAWQAVESVAVPGVAIQQLEVQTEAAMHTRYKIDGVPTTLLVDSKGVVKQAYFGPVEETDLRTALRS